MPGGGYPYPGQQGWFAVERTTNGLAIASLVTAFTCIPLLATGLGIGGLRQIRRRGQRGRGLAIAGIVINAVATIVVVLAVVLGATSDSGNTRVEDIKTGQCFNTVGEPLSKFGEGNHISRSVDVVSCDDEHDAEAFSVFTLDPTGHQAYPGAVTVAHEAGVRCASDARDYLGADPLPIGMDIFTYYPPASSWNDGHRSVTCFFGSRDGQVTGTVRDNGALGSSGSSGDGSDGGSGGSSDGGSDGGSGDGGDGGSDGSSGGGVGV
jgi:hypothetical protein